MRHRGEAEGQAVDARRREDDADSVVAVLLAVAAVIALTGLIGAGRPGRIVLSRQAARSP